MVHYLILSCTVNGRPTKSKVVWRSLVDVNCVKKAISTLKLCNSLYRDVERNIILNVRAEYIHCTHIKACVI